MATKPRDRYELDLPPPADAPSPAPPELPTAPGGASRLSRFLRFVRRLLLVALGTALLGYLALCVAAFLWQRSLVYAPPAPPSSAALEEQGVRRLSTQWVPLDVLHLPAPPGAPTVAFFHGNAEQLVDLLPLAKGLHRRGLGFFAVEYPGYGRSVGNPTEESLYAAAEAGLSALRAGGVPAEQTVLCGRSLGSGVAVEMAARGRGGRLVLFSPFTSVADVGKRAFPWLPVELLVQDRFDSAAKAPGVAVPALLFHGTRDEVVPTELGERLAGLLPKAKLELVPGAAHDDLFAEGGERLLDQVAAFARGP